MNVLWTAVNCVPILFLTKLQFSTTAAHHSLRVFAKKFQKIKLQRNMNMHDSGHSNRFIVLFILGELVNQEADR